MELKGNAAIRADQVKKMILNLSARVEEKKIVLNPEQQALWDKFDAACGDYIFIAYPTWSQINDMARDLYCQIMGATK